MNEKGLNGIQAKGRSWKKGYENWEVRKLQRVLYPMIRRGERGGGGRGAGIQFSCHGVFSCSCSQGSSLVGQLQRECRFGSFPEFESGSLLSLK